MGSLRIGSDLQLHKVVSPNPRDIEENASILRASFVPLLAIVMSLTSQIFENIDTHINSRKDELIKLRRHLHEHPELSFEEFQTTAMMANRLREAGFEVHVRPEGVGFYADIAPDDFDPEVHKTVAIRSDLDGLAIHELNDVSYASKKPGIMHACGHDVHMTCVMAAGMAVDRNTLGGRLRLLFQHAEEEVPGGALDMIKFGALEGVDQVIAMHVDPELEVGKVGVRKGAFTAAFDTFKITVIGKSGHGARPHHTVDPIFVVTQLNNALYQSISRYFDARDPMVLTIGMISGGRAPNVIPDTAFISGAIRTLSKEHRAAVQPLLIRCAEGVCDTFQARYELEFVGGAPAIMNADDITDVIAESAGQMLGKDKVYWIPLPSMGSEDFSHYLEHRQGAMFRLGVATPDRPCYFLHNARFDIDERAITIGARLLAHTAVKLLEA